MGHRNSKFLTASSSIKKNGTVVESYKNSIDSSFEKSCTRALTIAREAENLRLDLPVARIDGKNACSGNCISDSSSVSSINNTCLKQIIIKIQLAKMETGNEETQQIQNTLLTAQCVECCESNISKLELDGKIISVPINSINNQTILNHTRTAGGSNEFLPAVPTQSSNISSIFNNNNISTNSIIHTNQIKSECSTYDSAEYCEVLNELESSKQLICIEEKVREDFKSSEDLNSDWNSCCRRNIKVSYPFKRRCCKCTCRDAFKRILEPTKSVKFTKNKDRDYKGTKNSLVGKGKRSLIYNAEPLINKSTLQKKKVVSSSLNNNSPLSNPNSNQLSIWTPSASDVVIPLNSPQVVVVQCPSTSLLTLGRINDSAICLTTTDICSSTTPFNNTKNLTNGLVVHSQIDFVHCLVPDLDKITNCSFYWGKMDRYEAERLLEGKQEGTFLLRDSAQEEFLFSVTFRKFGRSLHARIEQSGHKFSFDCHDPSVFTASTVTGLLEHYKDPAGVMFFEPMLTIPLHRKLTFSLQQLSRATIVSQTSYDGINNLELPTQLKCYLKEYHYKQKLRVKPLNEPLYFCS